MLDIKFVKVSRMLFALLLAFVATVSTSVGQRDARLKNVDLVLLLALDVSASINSREYELMSKGLANALASPEVSQAILAGKNRAVAIAVVQWSGFQEQDVKINWTRIASRADLSKLVKKVRTMTRRYKGGATDIGGALKFSREFINSAPFISNRRTIDVAGDGANNVNNNPSAERDLTVKSGVVINGLAIIGEAVPLVKYYTYFVIGGKDAFVESARDYDSFETAMRHKLLREIGALYAF